MANTHIDGTINGSPVTEDIPANTLLLDFLRSKGLTGAKPSCELEVCGSCTVLVGGTPVSSCTTLAAEVDGNSVETIEGLADGDELHPVQEAFVDEFALQCGYCTPGMILSVKALLEENSAPTRDDIVNWLDGNICRCTGYESIIRATQRAARLLTGTGGDQDSGHSAESKVEAQ